MKKLTSFYFIKLLKFKTTYILPILLWLLLLLTIIACLIAIKTGMEYSFYFLFLSLDLNSLFILFIGLYSVVFGFTQTYNLFLSKKIENKKDFLPKYLAFGGLNLIISLITYVIFSIFIFVSDGYKSINNFI